MDKGTCRRAAANEEGIALVLTLMIVTLITALVVEFSYGVYVNTSALHNWQTMQSLSLLGKSTTSLAAKLILDTSKYQSYTYPGVIDYPTEKPVKDFDGSAVIRIEDENGKFNLNSLIYSNGLTNETAYQTFVRLLQALGLSTDIAPKVADWIDPDSEPRLTDSEAKAKNWYLDSVDELLLIKGIDRKAYEKLLPYVTIYGNSLININSASVPVLMALSDEVTMGMAQTLVQYRQSYPFQNTGDIMKVAGFEVVGTSLMGRITVKSSAFRVLSSALSGGVKGSIETILETSTGKPMVKYWRER